ncbi:hypothetical protein GUJ93_ZPchr0009g592 [Zizania palustris]|uniref:Uncharacterized protein n=1 Tax=Zizania palustris TaxID=103762 RepID=A0A8J5RL43_ZIZPA|nr:hypothetical protein GUJ93_ZPchr0009g592 [Zizania palustris]
MASDWAEEELINRYAVLMGYLSMAVRGLGFLVVLWTTVVLLGGFVTALGKKDFWCLTIITLVQTAGVFDVFLNEKLSYIRKSFSGFVTTVLGMVFRNENPNCSCLQILVTTVLLVLQLLVLAVSIVILCILGAVYLFGLLIAVGLSLWRLIQHDYAPSSGDANANLAPALKVLYSLALIQGVLFFYRFALRFPAKWIANNVAGHYGFQEEDHAGHKSVMDYLLQTRVECDKNPSFARGRNLVTFAFALMMKPESTSSGDFASGARILDKILQKEEERRNDAELRNDEELRNDK